MKFSYSSDMEALVRSLPSRERGLKCGLGLYEAYFLGVAPLAGAWIEMPYIETTGLEASCRSPRGSVD